jgi:hypothetical protein
MSRSAMFIGDNGQVEIIEDTDRLIFIHVTHEVVGADIPMMNAYFPQCIMT